MLRHKTRNLRRLLLDVMEGAAGRDSLGDRIAQARRDAGLTQSQLADLVGLKARQIQNYEAGDSNPYRKLSQIAPEATLWEIAVNNRNLAEVTPKPHRTGNSDTLPIRL